jgi:glycosyltransferase involved in cell wall biosynthesis
MPRTESHVMHPRVGHSSSADRILILSLGRNGGCLKYATAIIESWASSPFDLVTSAFSTEGVPRVAHRAVPTYRSRLEFVVNTLFVYPVLLTILFMRLLTGQYRALYLPYFHHWELGAVWLFRLFGRPVVYTVHDGIQHHGEEEALGAWIMSYSIKNATDLIFLTQSVARKVSERLAPRGRTSVIPHGVIALEGVTSSRKHSTRPVILFLGRIVPYKGVELLAEAVRGMDRHEFDRLVIAGSSRYALRIEPFDGLEIRDRWLPEQEIVELLNTSNILVLPYTEASQSGVIMLGMHAAIPMICTRMAGLEEQLTQNEAIFVEPRAADIRDAIRRLSCDAALYDSISESLRARARETSWQAISTRIAEVLRHPTALAH